MVWWLLLVPVAGFAASGDEFYQRLYQRGMAHFATGEYGTAFNELRNAAFGFVEQVEKFETVQTYATIAAHRLGHDDDARDSLLRIVAAEKVQPHFRSLKFPDEVWTEVDTVAAALLTTQEATILGVPEKVQSAAAKAKAPVFVPSPTRRPPVATTAPRESRDTDNPPPEAAAKTTPKPVTPVPQPIAPSPQPVVPDPQPRAATPVPQPLASVPQPIAPSPRPAAPTPQPRAATPVPQLPVPSPQPIAPAPQPVVVVPQPVVPTPQPAISAPQPVIRTPVPKHDPPKPQPVVPVPSPQPAVKGADTTLAEARRAIDNGEIGRARSLYNALLSGPALPHTAALGLAEGLYRVRDFAAASRAFQRAGTLGQDEGRYHYYFAVALYESGRYGEAKRELHAALPYIAITADVERYRVKIEGAIE